MDLLTALLHRTIITGCIAFLLPSASARSAEFSRDSAFATVVTLAREIGPRPMGSPAEQQALRLAVDRFRRAGCDTAWIMPMTVAASVNTTSGISVGVKRGATGRIILIGGHIDSAGPEVPGANDDASGAAVVMELARVLCQSGHSSTLMFCCWGGEEENLRGSTYFVDHFPLLDSIALMLQIDMANGGRVLNPDPDAGQQVSAPRWLVHAAYDVFYNEMHGSWLGYPTNFVTLNTVGSGGAGSDHIPFLERGIPAIDFTSDVNDPIHTPLDNLDNLDPAGLKRSGDLVLGLVRRFDGGVPDRSTDRYLLLQWGTYPLMITHLWLWVFIAVAVVVSVFALVAVRSREGPQVSHRIRWTGVKLFAATLLITACMWTSPDIVGWIRGIRFPWVNNTGGFLLLGVLAGAPGLWVSVRFLMSIRISRGSTTLLARSFVLLWVGIFLTGPGSPELSAYLAWALFWISLAVFARSFGVTALCLLISPYPLTRLVFSDATGLIQRLLMRNPVEGFSALLYDAGWILFFGFLALPFVYAYAALQRDSGADLLFIRRFGLSALPAILVAAAAVAVGVYLSVQPVYQGAWLREIRVEHQAGNAGPEEITIRSSEYLDGVAVHTPGRDTTLHGRIRSYLPDTHPGVPMVKIHSRDSLVARGDNAWTVQRVLLIGSVRRPYHVEVAYTSDQPFDLSSPWAIGGGRRRGEAGRLRKVLTWYSFPDTLLHIPVTLSCNDSQRVVQTTEVVFDTVAYPLRAEAEDATTVYRTRVTERDTIGVARATYATGE